MNDKITEAAPQETKIQDGGSLFNTYVDLAKNGMGQAGFDRDPNSLKVLESGGVLPGVNLFDSNESKNVADSRSEKTEEVMGQSKIATAPLEEPGDVKERLAPGLLTNWETVTYYDDTKRQIFPDGYIKETRPNGMEIHMRPDNSITVMEGSDSRTVRPSYLMAEVKGAKVEEDGTVVYQYKDGTKETYYPMGSHSIKHKDGTLDVIEKDGSKTNHAPGHRTTYDANGNKVNEHELYPDKSLVRRNGKDQVEGTVGPSPENKIRTFKYGPDGELTQMHGFTGDWKRMEDENGKSLWVNTTSGKVWHGDFKVDREGNVKYTPHDRNSSAWMFTRDGQDVKVRR